MNVHDASGRLSGELWARFASVISQIAKTVAEGELQPDIDEQHEEGLSNVDWFSKEADLYLREVDDALRDNVEPHIWDVLEYEDEYGPEPEEDERALQLALAAIKEAIRQRDRDNLRVLLDDLYAACELFGLDLGELFERAESALALLEVTVQSLLYLPPPPQIYIPQLLIESNATLIRELARRPQRLYEISPRKFEEVVAELFWAAGYEVELTKSTRDGGRDIIALSHRMDVPIRLIVECKRYAPQNKVTLALVQRLFGVKLAESANKAILATTSTFTRDARMFACSHIWDLDLKDHDAVVAWLRKYPNITA